MIVSPRSRACSIPAAIFALVSILFCGAAGAPATADAAEQAARGKDASRGKARAACIDGAMTVILRDLVEPAPQARAFCASFATAGQAWLRRVCLAARARGLRELPLQDAGISTSR